jgi:hypothetical protein
MPVSYKSELVGVFGHPVAENPTIVMQEAAFRELDQQRSYVEPVPYLHFPLPPSPFLLTSVFPSPFHLTEACH